MVLPYYDWRHQVNENTRRPYSTYSAEVRYRARSSPGITVCPCLPTKFRTTCVKSCRFEGGNREYKQKPKSKKKPKTTKSSSKKDDTFFSVAAAFGENCCVCCATILEYFKEIFKLVFCLSSCRLPTTNFQNLLCDLLETAGNICRNGYKILLSVVRCVAGLCCY